MNQNLLIFIGLIIEFDPRLGLTTMALLGGGRALDAWVSSPGRSLTLVGCLALGCLAAGLLGWLVDVSCSSFLCFWEAPRAARSAAGGWCTRRSRPAGAKSPHIGEKLASGERDAWSNQC